MINPCVFSRISELKTRTGKAFRMELNASLPARFVRAHKDVLAHTGALTHTHKNSPTRTRTYTHTYKEHIYLDDAEGGGGDGI